MAYSESEWNTFLQNSNFFSPHIEIWQQFLRHFGTINIVQIIGVTNLLGDFVDVDSAFANPQFINRVDVGIMQYQSMFENNNQADNNNEAGAANNQAVDEVKNLLEWIRHRLRDQLWLQRYAGHLQHGLLNAYRFQQNNEIPLSEAIANQPRRIAPRPAHDRPYCAYCTSSRHTTAKCPKAGTVRRDNRGRAVAFGAFPRCFVCGNRHHAKSATNFHYAENCRFRHPFSRIGVHRPCTCRCKLQRCWNCAIPVCLNRWCRHYGHRNSTCTHPRYNPEPPQCLYGENADFRMSLHQRMMALGIRRMPRELRFIPTHTNMQLEDSSNRGESTSQAVEDTDRGPEIDIAEDVVNAVEQVEEEQEMCTFCMDDINTEKYDILQCRHSYHSDCLSRHLSTPNTPNVCPLCRKKAVIESTVTPAGAGPSTSRWANDVPSAPNFYEIPIVQQHQHPIVQQHQHQIVQQHQQAFNPTISHRNVADPEERLMGLLLRSQDDFDGFQMSQYSLIHLIELANHIRLHGINWNDRTYPMIAALLSRVTRSAQLEIHNAIMPAIFDEIHTMEELDTIVLYVNSSTPSRVRRGRMQQFVDLCRARILS